MRSLRIAALLALAVFAATATTSSAAVSSPTGLHGFLLRADEPATSSFSRTPSFAWTPVPGARTLPVPDLDEQHLPRQRRPLQQRDADEPRRRAEPDAAVDHGHAARPLRARSRRRRHRPRTPWSAPSASTSRRPPPPTPLPSYPGLLRWTPTDGRGRVPGLADRRTRQDRVRPHERPRRARVLHVPSEPAVDRQRALARARAARRRVQPAAQRHARSRTTARGARSTVSSNPAMTGGPITLIGTVSDVFSDGSPSSPAHQLMPAFMWSGNQTLVRHGRRALPRRGLHRQHVPEPRLHRRRRRQPRVGAAARRPARPAGRSRPRAEGAHHVPPDGTETSSQTFDGTPLTPAEQQAPATPTTTVPGDIPAFPGTTPPGGTDPTSGGSSGGGTSTITVTGSVGPPVVLWDVDWPESGYYWTVIPVVRHRRREHRRRRAGRRQGRDASFRSSDTSGFTTGDSVTIGTAPATRHARSRRRRPARSRSTTATTTAIRRRRGHDTRAARSSTGRRASRRTRAKPAACSASASRASPSLTTCDDAVRDRPVLHRTAHLGREHVDVLRQPARRLDAGPQRRHLRGPVEQDGCTRSSREIDPRSSSKGFLTFSTADILPLAAGTWYYRVRGIDYNLPTGVQQMSWSTPQRLVVAQPKFKVAPAPKKKFKVVP